MFSDFPQEKRNHVENHVENLIQDCFLGNFSKKFGFEEMFLKLNLQSKQGDARKNMPIFSVDFYMRPQYNG